MSNYLIIFEEVPEATKVYYVESVSDEDAMRLEACHGKFVGGDDTPELDWLGLWIKDKTVIVKSECGDTTPHFAGYFEFTHIIITGFLL